MMIALIIGVGVIVILFAFWVWMTYSPLKPKPQQDPEVKSLASIVGVVPTYAEWRASRERVSIAAQLLSSEAAREMVQVLRADPTHKSYLVTLGDEKASAAAFWYRRGYDLALTSLEKLGELAETPKDPGDPTFEDED